METTAIILPGKDDSGNSTIGYIAKVELTELKNKEELRKIP